MTKFEDITIIFNFLTRYQHERHTARHFETVQRNAEKRSVHSSLHSYYLKWLRYYLDYCSKYRLPEKSSRSMTQFLRKLKDKKQTEAQQKQAGHAVSLYLDLEKTVKTIPSNIAPAIVQPPTLNPYSTLPSENKKDSGHAGMTVRRLNQRRSLLRIMKEDLSLRLRRRRGGQAYSNSILIPAMRRLGGRRQ